MALANVANTDTFQTWLTRTNQLVVSYNQLSAGFGGTISSSNTITSTNTTMALNVASGYIKVKANIFDSNVVTVISNTPAIAITGTGRLGDRLYVNVGTLSSTTSDRSNTNIASANAVNSLNEYARYMAASINAYSALTYSGGGGGVSSLAPANAWANLVGQSANSFQSNYIVGSTQASNIAAARSANAWANFVGQSANSGFTVNYLPNTNFTYNNSMRINELVAFNSLISNNTIRSNGSYISSFSSGMKNRLINGDFRFWQRGTSFQPATYSVSTGYTADRWLINRLGGLSSTVIASRISLSLNNADRNAIRVRRTTGDAYIGSTYRIQLAQQIETMNFADLGGKPVTLSFWARKGANFSGSFQVLIVTGTGTNEPAYSPFTGELTPLLQTVTLQTTYVKYTYSANIPNNNTEGRVVFIYDPSTTAGTNDWFEVTDVQLEQGYVDTEFERRDYATEFAMCRRYYENGLGWNGAIDGSDPSGTLYANYTRATYGGYLHQLTVPYRVTKRTAPTVTTIPYIAGTPSPTGVDGYVRNLSKNKNVAAYIDNISNNFFNVNIGTTPQTGNPGPNVDDVWLHDGFAFNWAVNAEL